MKKSIMYDNVEIQYLYPFEISDWRKLKHLTVDILDRGDFPKNPSRSTAMLKLEKEISEGSEEKHELKKFKKEYSRRRINNNKSFLQLCEDHLHTTDGKAHALFKLRLKKLKEQHDSSRDKRFFNFLESIITSNGTKAVFDDSERKGTRPYLLKNLPHILITPPSTDLIISNLDAFPNLKESLINVDVPSIRIQTNIKLLSSGFGLVKMRCCVFTRQGLDETINEIVFSSETKSCLDEKKLIQDKKNLSAKIKDDIEDAIKTRNSGDNKVIDRLNKNIKAYCQEHCLTDIYLRQNIANLIDRANFIEEPCSTSEVVDIHNLDRGTGWGKEPVFKWTNNGNSSGKLYNYFDALVNENIVKPIKELGQKRLTPLYRDAEDASKMDSDLESALCHMERDNTWYANEGIYPYILTFISAPSSFKKPGAKRLGDIEDNFSKQLAKPEHKVKLARILMKSPWKKMRIDIDPLKKSLENVFYSDLLYMTVNIRSTLCFYYLPLDPVYEYDAYPELYNSIKYKRELEDTIVAQRTLWYMYSTFNHKVSDEIKSISRTFESLTEHIRKEEFHQILDELAEITMGIDNRKIAITEVMEDPLNRKGSTLFTHMLSKSSKAFRLRQLYLTLIDKLERLDMLGLHVNQTTNQLSSMVIQETSRATQFTIEVLEAFIIGVYFAEVVHLSTPAWLEHSASKPIIFFTLSISAPLIALPMITLIRKSMSRFRGRTPIWQEWVEKIGLGLGLTVLSILTFFILSQEHFFKDHPFRYLILFALLGVPVLVYLLWHRANSRYEQSD